MVPDGLYKCINPQVPSVAPLPTFLVSGWNPVPFCNSAAELYAKLVDESSSKWNAEKCAEVICVLKLVPSVVPWKASPSPSVDDL